MSGMICEICGETIASVHLTEIVNNTKKEIHLCEACAQQKGVAIHSHVKNLSIPEFFGQLADSPAEEENPSSAPRCPNCRVTYQAFRNTGKLGCPECYDAFRSEMEHLAEKIHAGSTRHRGKVPTRLDRALRRQQELEELRVELLSAVEQEEYEHAAELRDRIHDLEREEQCS
ncbi:MAG: UvrB/UvrC motif-containing protein [Planctomycetota bacterium]